MLGKEGKKEQLNRLGFEDFQGFQTVWHWTFSRELQKLELLKGEMEIHYSCSASLRHKRSLGFPVYLQGSSVVSSVFKKGNKIL